MGKQTVSRAPKFIISICCEAVARYCRDSLGKGYRELTGGSWSMSWAHRTECGKWKCDSTGSNEPREIFPIVAALTRKHGSSLVIVPRVSEFFGLIEGWNYIQTCYLSIPGFTATLYDAINNIAEERKEKPGLIAIGGSSEIISGRIYGNNVAFIGCNNYFPGTLGELFEGIIGAGAGSYAITSDHGRYLGVSPVIATAARQWLCAMIDAWRLEGIGPWRLTASQLSHSAGRKMYGTKAYKPTERPDVRLMEREACYGGRAEVWSHQLYGFPTREDALKVLPGTGFRTYRNPSRVHRWDIKSCYPYIMGNFLAPEMLLSRESDRCTVRMIEQDDNVIQLAVVKVCTDEPQYPLRIRDEAGTSVFNRHMLPLPRRFAGKYRTIFPIGTFTTVLCGAELKLAAERGHIQEVYNLCTYSTTNAIQGHVKRCYYRRIQCDERGDNVGAMLWKLLANAYLGKFAALAPRWEMCSDAGAPFEWGSWVEYDDAKKEYLKYRSIGSIAQVSSNYRDNPRSHPIMFAWVTGMARTMLFTTMKLAGLENIIQCDTDGLYVNDDGHKRMSIMFDATRAKGWGDWRHVSTSRDGRFYGPKHYYTSNDGWTLAGVPDGFTIEDSLYGRANTGTYLPMPTGPRGSFAGRLVTFRVIPKDSCERKETPGQFGLTEPLKCP